MTEVVSLLNRTKSAIAALLLIMLVAPMATPLASASDNTQARSSPDFSVTSFTLDGAGSVQSGADIYVENATHTVRVIVSNTGSAAGTVTVSLYHQGSSSSGKALVSSLEIGPIDPGTSSSPVLIQWTATPGNGQSIFAEVFATNDVNPGNDERRINFDVRSPVYLVGTVLDNSIPEPALGQSEARIANIMQTFDTTVINEGVRDITANFELIFTEVADPSNSMAFYSGEQIIQPGSLLIAPVATNLSTTFNAGLMSGLWQLTASVIFNGTGAWTDTVLVNSSTIGFSEYIASLSVPADRTTEPGLSTTLTFILTNLGSQSDSFNYVVTSSLGWVSSPLSGTTNSFSPGLSESIQVTVAVPASASRSEIDIVELTATSVDDPNVPSYSLVSSARVMSGELYQASLTMPSITTRVTPGQSISFNATITNIGNVPGSFTLSAGFSIASTTWNVVLSAYSTGVINETDNAVFAVNITVPPIKLPIDIADHNRAGDVLNVWVQAIPIAGGIPVTGSSPLEVNPIIVVDPGLNEETIQLTENDLIAAKNGQGVDIQRAMQVEVRHNMNSPPAANSVDAEIVVGNLTFTPLNSGGFSETGRWSSEVSPNVFSALDFGDVESAALGIQGPDDGYPLAGTISVPVVATPTLNGSAPIPFVQIVSVSRNLSINVPSVQGAEIIGNGPFDVPLGEQTPIDLLLSNTGNDLTSYRLSVLDDLPDGWVTSVNTTSSTADTILDLPANVYDWPIAGNSHMEHFQLKVTTDPLAEAYSIQDVNIKVEDSTTGLLIDIIPVSIRVGPYVNASLSPTNQTVELNTTLSETPLTRVYVTNTGNTPTTYSLWLDDSQSTNVDFTLESPNEILVAPGFTDSVKVRLSATDDADSDEFYMATLWVSTDTGVNLSAAIVANVSEKRDLSVDSPFEIGVLPGQEQVVNFTVTNLGNLVETFNVSVEVDGGWIVVPATQTITLPNDQTTDGSVTVTVPELGAGISLDDGSIHNLTIELIDPATNLVAGKSTTRMLISPMFILDISDWQEEMQYHRQWDRTFTATIVNVGNRDVTVDLDYQINKPGGIAPSPEWVVQADAPKSLSMPIGENVSFQFTVSGVELSPDLDLTALLSIKLVPQQEGIDGEGYLNSTLAMSRFFESSDFELKPDESDGPITAYITYSHIPRGASNAVAYELELCEVTRLFDFSDNGLDESLYPWTFTLQLDSTTSIPLPLSPEDCGATSAGNESRIQLPSREAWTTDDPLTIIVDAPNRPNIITEDGWDLTFRLFHPTENAGYTVYDEATFTFQLDVFADPKVDEVWISQGNMQEGTDAEISARIRNDGTALALFFLVDLQCSGSTVNDVVDPIVQLGPNDERVVSWNITSDKIDWWRQSIDGTCTVIIDAEMLSKNVEGNDRYIYKDEVYSWSPGQSSTFVAFIIFGLLSLVLSRLNGQNEKFRLFGVYSGLLALGFAFHLFNVIYWGPLVLIIAALWLWRMTWMSTDEFRLIHEDYQRARKGVSTLYADHFQALADNRRQLRVILALPIFGLLGVILGIPPQLDSGRDNLLTLAVYVLVVSLGVWILVKRADSMYGSIYGRLTDIEVKSTRIERDLSDPARLLHELANDGINLDAIFDDLPQGEFGMDEEVIEDV